MTDDEKEIVATIKLSLLRAIVDLNEETLAMAIKVPKSEEPSEDCVSRQAMLKEIPRLWNSRGDKDYCMETLRDFVTELPPVTPTRKVGKWTNGNPICPCCGEDKFKDLDADIWADWQPRYCPNCGAEMESE